MSFVNASFWGICMAIYFVFISTVSTIVLLPAFGLMDDAGKQILLDWNLEMHTKMPLVLSPMSGL